MPRTMTVDRKGWRWFLLVLVPVVIAFVLVNHHYRAQTLLDQEATRVLLQEIYYTYDPARYAPWKQPAAADAGIPEYRILVKSTMVKGRGAFRIGRVEIVLRRDHASSIREVRYFRADDMPDYGWMISWDVNPLAYYFWP